MRITGPGRLFCPSPAALPALLCLLATGDDKVVRVWDYRVSRLDPRSMKVLRWSAWRERRGAIHALAVFGGGRSNAPQVEDHEEDGSTKVVGELLNAENVPLCVDRRKFNYHLIVAGGGQE
jgi:hypothetical protein